ncbi:heterokaryon incompatibility protein-domain-containing protein [Sordaria brevicollis]|uniref:Heterokaryon incompatibility protein-domain-containing protein n=1 Tax=Sordaria brevicollis TaxID=83679 RepID=A0AAE0PN40_SORBR|nr:heterokaryon incompatibility protein-domain-containing protein [Sordaria brevicollis]
MGCLRCALIRPFQILRRDFLFKSTTLRQHCCAVSLSQLLDSSALFTTITFASIEIFGGCQTHSLRVSQLPYTLDIEIHDEMAPVNERHFSYDSVSLLNASTHIRLLELCPVPAKNDELYCKLYTAPITNLPRYSAVSYAWGDNAQTHTIRIVDSDQAQTLTEEGLGYNPESFSVLPITSSLNTCLRQFRTYKELRLTPLWIDQICINQDDNVEKSCQIQLMGQIYSSARQVYAWLGLDADGSDEVIQAFCQVAEHMWDSGLFGNDHRTTNWFPAPRAIFFNHIHKPEVQDLLWKVIPILEPLLREKKILAWYKRTWFSRVWTIQEFCLNPYTFFVCGDRAVLDEVVLLVWEIFHILLAFKNGGRFRDAFKTSHPEILSLMDSLSANLIPPPMQHLFETKVSWKRGKRTSMRDLLEVVSTRLDLGENRLDILSTKYRDRVYGLLGLAYLGVRRLGIVPTPSHKRGGKIFLG